MSEAVTANESMTTPASSGTGVSRFLASAMEIDNANRVLFILAAITALYFVMVVLIGAGKLAGVPQHIHKLELSGAQATASSSTQSVALTVKPVDPALENRNIFQPAGTQTSSGDESASVGTTSSYKLVGISEARDSSDTYVMVENAQTKLTYFLQYGQPVEGLELEKILDDKVIVKIGGNSVELE